MLEESWDEPANRGVPNREGSGPCGAMLPGFGGGTWSKADSFLR